MLTFTQIRDMEVYKGVSDHKLKSLLKKHNAPIIKAGVSEQMPLSETSPLEAIAISLGRGGKSLVENIGITGSLLGEKAGFIPEGQTEQLKQEALKGREFFKRTPVGETSLSDIGALTGEVAPFVAVPGFLGGKLGTKVLTGMGLGAGIGALQPEDRGLNAAIGGTIGAVLPTFPGIASLGRKAVSGVKRAFGSEAQIAQDLFGHLTPEQAQQGLRRAGQAENLGMELTPAEATLDPLLAAAEGDLAKSTRVGKSLALKSATREKRIGTNIRDLKKGLAPSSRSAAEEVRLIAQEAVETKTRALAQTARPLYESAEATIIPDEVIEGFLQSKTISSAIQRVEATPAMADALAGFEPNSLKRFDLAKKVLDDDISAARTAGKKELARNTLTQKNILVDALDEISPDYKAARSIYAEGMPLTDRVVNNRLLRLSKLKDDQLKTATKIILDPKETDISRLSELRDFFNKKNPKVWGRIIRNDLERVLSETSSSASNRGAFYNTVFKNDAKYKMYLTATKNMPSMNKKLRDMKQVFEGVFDPLSPRGEKFRTQSFLNSIRNSSEAAQVVVRNLLGGAYDNAAIEVLKQPKWTKEFAKIAAKKGAAKQILSLSKFLDRIQRTIVPAATSGE